jgi:hypothetical protein
MPVMKAVMDCVSGGHVFLLVSAGLVLCSSATGNRNGIMPCTARLDAASAKNSRCRNQGFCILFFSQLKQGKTA